MTIQMVVIAVALVLFSIAIVRLLSAWNAYRGQRVVTCPENTRPAGVTVDTGHAAATCLTGKPELKLSSCSRWPERAGCGQACLSEIAAAPEDCLVRNILAKWYEGKTCAWCGKAIPEVSGIGAHAAVLSADRVTVEWSEIPAEQLPDTLAAGSPICFSCHMASKMLREHPELVIDRSERTVRKAN
jgi:hypothetical protein